VAVALVGTSREGKSEILPLVDGSTAKKHFAGSARYLLDVLYLVLESCETHLRSQANLDEWQPPLEGVFLGAVQNVYSLGTVGELLHMAAPITSFLYRDPLGKSDSSSRRPSLGMRLGSQVQELVVQTNRGFKCNFNVSLPFGRYDTQVNFTFLHPAYPTSLITLNGKRIKQCLETGRAKLWALHLLSDASNYLFRPRVRDLVMGTDFESCANQGLLDEAKRGLSDETESKTPFWWIRVLVTPKGQIGQCVTNSASSSIWST